MYSSGGDLHLELPDGATEGSDAIWQIQPYQTKAVMKANFVARFETNHTAYIRIKTNTTGAGMNIFHENRIKKKILKTHYSRLSLL